MSKEERNRWRIRRLHFKTVLEQQQQQHQHENVP